MPSDLLKHLLGLEKLKDHDLGFTLFKIDFCLSKFSLVGLVIRVLLGEFPSSKSFHEIRVVVGLLHHERALSLEETTKLLRNILGRFDLLLTLELVSKLLGLLNMLFTLGNLLLHDELLTLLFNIVGAVKGLKLAFQALQESFLLLLSHAFILVTLLDLFLLLFDTFSELSCISIELFLDLLLALKHVLVVAESIREFLLELVLNGLLLQLNISETTLLLLLLLALILLESLLVSQGLAIDKSLISDELPPEFGLLASHLRSEIDLLSSMLLLKLLSHGCLFALVGILKFEVDVAEKILLAQAQRLHRVVVDLLGHLILHLF